MFTDAARARARERAGARERAREQIAEQAERTAGEVRGGAEAATARAADRVATTVARGRRGARKQADRAAVAGAGVGEELDTAADRSGRRIHAVTEAAAGPLDHLTHHVLARVETLAQTLNPVRITGRGIGATIAGGLHLASVITACGTRDAQHGVHTATDSS